MPRPIRCRRVCGLPNNTKFGPLDGETNESNIINMTVDEYETIRLIDLEGLTQEGCADQMSVARTTIQGIYNKARTKLADALVNGKVLFIEGGEYQVCGDRENCPRRGLHNHLCNGRRCRIEDLKQKEEEQ